MHDNLNLRVLVITIVTMFALGAFGAPVIDGRFDESEGYTTGSYVDYCLDGTDGGEVVARGRLWTFQDTNNDLYVAMVAPRSVVDNSYGENSIGWKEKKDKYGHQFSDLLKSDKASFLISDSSGGLVIDFSLDYLGVDESAESGYSSLGMLDGGKKAKADGAFNDGNEDALSQWATSLDYNFNVSGHVLTEHSPEAGSDYDIVDEDGYGDWIFDVVYEFRIDGLILGGNGFQIAGELSHISPEKTDYDISTISEPIPEPATLLLGSFGVVCMRLMRRRRG